ncbi:transposase [Streptomyces sp. RLB3-17]|uniref:RNA-guided endonuclease InsQ/TnpB family protein n=1 Tax=unclassified Streptomyces TaxID=2593676 RepID=UPI001165C6EF|nr:MULTISPECIES: RNA-guided endonuclease TnpB family protein [unclassified Streptomyces]NMI54457.1 transposase [Streptomyces sp. RLA2-12]QDN62971.1 transposase [Streptomyces sp. S1D4-20]QDN73022.1 transposase [Streptomyces sp. S1D4-14]QDO45597.1 transposase [Streptomyces sp. RLB3-17]QDO55621.1 transposase [Streptomyces sp. RLB3-5]
MIRAYKFLMRPTQGQQGALAEMLRDHCSLYNGALQERRDAYRHASKTTVRYGQQSAQLKDIRAFDPERQGRWSFSSQQATLRRLDKAFAAFFRRVKAGDKPGYPRFRSGKRFDTVDFPKDGDGCRWDSTPHDPVTRVRLQGVGHVKVHQHRPVAGKVKTISVKREGRRWYVILTADQAQPEPLPATGSVVGVDMGIANFLADSNGEFVPNPRHGAKASAKLEVAQQALSRCKRGSKRRRKAVDTVARLHRKVRRQRLDHAHKTALDLVREHDFVAHEDLKIRNMNRAPAPKPDPNQQGSFLPNGASAKAGLNRSIADAGWGVFLAILAAKAEGAGRQVMAVDPRNTSRTCPECRHVSAENRPTQEKFHCVSCDHTAHADTVGAINVLRAGLVRRDATLA